MKKNINRDFVYVYPSVHGTTIAVNYSGRSDVNTFLGHFDAWSASGHQVLCSDENHSKFEFECSDKFCDFCHTNDFRFAFIRMGVELTFDYEDVKDIETTNDVHTSAASYLENCTHAIIRNLIKLRFRFDEKNNDCFRSEISELLNNIPWFEGLDSHFIMSHTINSINISMKEYVTSVVEIEHNNFEISFIEYKRLEEDIRVYFYWIADCFSIYHKIPNQNIVNKIVVDKLKSLNF